MRSNFVFLQSSLQANPVPHPVPPKVWNMLYVENGGLGGDHPLPVSGAQLCRQNELAGLTEVHCASNGFAVNCSA